MYAALEKQLAEKTASLPSSVLGIVDRANGVGLHKLAAQLRAQEDFGLEHAVRELGVKLAYAHLKQRKIASGLGSLRDLHIDETVKLANLFKMMGKSVQKMLPQAKSVAPAVPTGTTLAGGGGLAGRFSNPPAAPAGFAKRTVRGASLPPERTGVSHMPSAPVGTQTSVAPPSGTGSLQTLFGRR